uniref:DB domain-containing protein n=1 Tax=Globodera pallida TaxID=36090 RepID=A0A183CHD5_GLOPA
MKGRTEPRQHWTLQQQQQYQQEQQRRGTDELLRQRTEGFPVAGGVRQSKDDRIGMRDSVGQQPSMGPQHRRRHQAAPKHQQIMAATTTGPEPAPLYPEGSEDAAGSLFRYKNFGFDLPCTGFSDESCFQQQTQLRPNEMHRCCRGRILFTDQCVAGKCSNATVQLCCIQRFLQAKLSCCSDERQADVDVGDHFSHCCFENFVDGEGCISITVNPGPTGIGIPKPEIIPTDPGQLYIIGQSQHFSADIVPFKLQNNWTEERLVPRRLDEDS